MMSLKCEFIASERELMTVCYSRPFYEKRIAQEVEADFLGDEWKVSCKE